MKAAPYRHIGGAIVADHGPIRLGEARALARFYAREARLSAMTGAVKAARICRLRARALNAAARDAEAWRRAAGWRRPADADRRRLVEFRG